MDCLNRGRLVLSFFLFRAIASITIYGMIATTTIDATLVAIMTYEGTALLEGDCVVVPLGPVEVIVGFVCGAESVVSRLELEGGEVVSVGEIEENYEVADAEDIDGLRTTYRSR